VDDGAPEKSATRSVSLRPAETSQGREGDEQEGDQIDAAKAVESGELIKFSCRVLDADKARPQNDKTNEPVMFDPDGWSSAATG
jgi:hypothetical protein